MKLAELIARVENIRPSEYDKTDLTQWVNEVEFMALDQVINRAEGADITFKPYDYEMDAEKELMIPDQFNGVYTTYLCAKIDLHNAEIERGNLDSTMFDAEWKAYAYWYRRTHKPKRLGGK